MKTQKRIDRVTVLLSLFLTGAIALWGIQVSAEEWTDAQKEVLKSVEAGWESILKDDIETLGARSAEGFLTWWPARANPFGKDSINIRYLSWFTWNKPVSYELNPIAISIIGDTSLVFYYYKWKGDKQPDTEVSGRLFQTYIKQDGKWKYAGGMGCSCDTTPFCF